VWKTSALTRLKIVVLPAIARAREAAARSVTSQL